MACPSCFNATVPNAERLAYSTEMLLKYGCKQCGNCWDKTIGQLGRMVSVAPPSFLQKEKEVEEYFRRMASRVSTPASPNTVDGFTRILDERYGDFFDKIVVRDDSHTRSIAINFWTDNELNYLEGQRSIPEMYEWIKGVVPAGVAFQVYIRTNIPAVLDDGMTECTSAEPPMMSEEQQFASRLQSKLKAKYG